MFFAAERDGIKMAGSLAHIVDGDGTFTMDLIENMGDAHEALEDCFLIIQALTQGEKKKINKMCQRIDSPQIAHNLSLDTQPSSVVT